MEVRSWSRGFIQSFIPPRFADTMYGICVEEADVWREVRRRNDGSTLPALSNLVHRSSVDQRETVLDSIPVPVEDEHKVLSVRSKL